MGGAPGLPEALERAIRALALPRAPGAYLSLPAILQAARRVGVEAEVRGDRLSTIRSIVAAAAERGSLPQLLLEIEGLARAREAMLSQALSSSEGGVRVRIERELEAVKSLIRGLEEARAALEGRS